MFSYYFDNPTKPEVMVSREVYTNANAVLSRLAADMTLFSELITLAPLLGIDVYAPLEELGLLATTAESFIKLGVPVQTCALPEAIADTN